MVLVLALVRLGLWLLVAITEATSLNMGYPSDIPLSGPNICCLSRARLLCSIHTWLLVTDEELCLELSHGQHLYSLNPTFWKMS